MMRAESPRPRHKPPLPPSARRAAETGGDNDLGLVGRVVDRRYSLKREIARGGTAAVFEADHTITGRPAAVKLLCGPHAGKPESHARLLKEARVLELSRGPGVVELLDAGICERVGPYLVMEMLEGRTLAGLLTSRGRLPVEDTVRLGIQLCAALARAHRHQVVHRDIKPSNVFLARAAGGEAVKVFDFGIAAQGAASAVPAVADNKLTKQDEIVGTPEYMSPERLLTKPFDHRADVYAIGVTLYECLTGAVPFEGNYAEVLLKTSTQPLPSVVEARPDVPRGLAEVLDRALAKEQSERLGDVTALARALVQATGISPGPTALLGIVPPPMLGATLTKAAKKPAAQSPVARRRFARAPYVTPVRILLSDGQHIDGNSEDISEGGLLVSTPRPCENGDLVEVRFALPLSGHIVRLEAISRWVRTARNTGATGLQFTSSTEEMRQDIAEYVRAMGGVS